MDGHTQFIGSLVTRCVGLWCFFEHLDYTCQASYSFVYQLTGNLNIKWFRCQHYVLCCVKKIFAWFKSFSFYNEIGSDTWHEYVPSVPERPFIVRLLSFLQFNERNEQSSIQWMSWKTRILTMDNGKLST